MRKKKPIEVLQNTHFRVHKRQAFTNRALLKIRIPQLPHMTKNIVLQISCRLLLNGPLQQILPCHQTKHQKHAGNQQYNEPSESDHVCGWNDDIDEVLNTLGNGNLNERDSNTATHQQPKHAIIFLHIRKDPSISFK
ncbi:hypothetical protein D3C74_324320 [compost metagenome]